MPRTIQQPTITQRPGDDYIEHNHPAFAVMGVSRISGGADLFGSHVSHQHFIRLRVAPAYMQRNGYSEFIYGRGAPYIEVDMTEAQWAAVIGTMNVGSGVPCTLNTMYDHTNKLRVDLPGLPPQESAAERIDAQSEEMLRASHRAAEKAGEELLVMLDRLPKKVQNEAHGKLQQVLRLSETTRDFQRKCLRETSEKLVTEAKVEIDAMLTNVVQQLGLQSVQQLGAILTADPASASQLITQRLGRDNDIAPGAE